MSQEATKSPIRLKCIYGNKVRIKNLGTGIETDYMLVNFGVEKIDENQISNYTRVGKAIWAKHEGDEVEIEIPGQGKQKHRIIAIENA